LRAVAASSATLGNQLTAYSTTNIMGYTSITTMSVTGPVTFMSSLYITGVSSFTSLSNIHIVGGDKNDVLMKNGTGGPLKWGAVPGANDNLGSHVSTRSLDMSSFDIVNVSTMSVARVTSSDAGVVFATNVLIMNGHVSGTSGSAYAMEILAPGVHFSTASTPDTGLYLSASGNVGIGTANPTAALHVVGVSSITASITVHGVNRASVPRGMVMYFNLNQCPTGWGIISGAQGRYMVGMPASGLLGGTTGQAMADLSARTSGVHTHQMHIGETVGVAAYISGTATSVYPAIAGALPAPVSMTISNSGKDVTPAPYIQLLVCQKN